VISSCFHVKQMNVKPTRETNHREEDFGFVGLKLQAVLLVSALFCMNVKCWLLALQQGHRSTILSTVGWIQLHSLGKGHLGVDME
jgi:hypothetical protein